MFKIELSTRLLFLEKIPQIVFLHNKSLKRKTRLSSFLMINALFVFSFFNPNLNLSAQAPSCTYPIQCYDTNGPYKVADFSFGLATNLSQLIPLAFLDPASAMTQPQFIEIKVPIIVDINYTFAPGSELVFSTESARLIVNKSLTLTGVHLHGCDKMWPGIKVADGGTLVASQNCIQDAFKAISLDNGSKFEIYQNSFNRNYISIFGGKDNEEDPALTRLFPIGKGISGNDFSGLDNLIYPIAGSSKPLCAIRLHSVLELSIGSSIGGINLIHNFNTSTTDGLSQAVGLYIANSNVSLQQTRFSDIGIGKSGTAVSAYNKFGQRYLHITGLGATNSLPTFQKCEASITAYDVTDLKVNDCFFEFNIRNIWIEPTLYQHRFDISQNRFKSFLESSITSVSGIYNNCTIKNNSFEDDLNALSYDPIFEFFPPNMAPLGLRNLKNSIVASGIEFQHNLGAWNMLDISNNEFYELPKGAFSDNYSGGYGVSLFYVNEVAKIDNNMFSQQHSGFDDHYYKGISLYSSHKNRITNNSFSGVSNYNNPIVPDEGISAISVFESNGNYIGCNDFSNIKEGVRFRGFGCDGTKLTANSFTGHDIGVLLFDVPTRIGKQVKNHNIWPGQSDVEALYDGNPAPTFLELSRFKIETFESPNNILWANPRIPLGLFEPNFDATNNSPETDVYYCKDEQEGGYFTSSEALVLADNFPVYEGFTALTWEAAFDLYDKLLYKPELRPAGSLAEVFFNAKYGTNLAKLQEAMTQYAAVNTMPDAIVQQWDNNMEQVSTLANQMGANHNITPQAITPTEKSQLLAALQQMNSQLDSLMNARSSLETIYLTERQSRLNQLSVLLNSIAPNEIYESNLKTVLTVLTEALMANQAGHFTPNQLSRLKSVAIQCRYSGGIAVIIARGHLNGEPGIYDDATSCEAEIELRSGQNIENTTTLSGVNDIDFAPNPVQELLQISIHEKVEEGIVRLFDTMGSTIQEYTLDPGTTTVTFDVSNQSPGIYFISGDINGKSIGPKKIIVANKK